MKYVDWVDRVLNASAQLAARDDNAAIFGLQTLQLPAALGFGEVASQPGFTDGPLWDALHDALKDLDALGLIEDNDVWHVKLSREGLKATDLSISTEWHRIFDEVEPSEQEMELLAYAAREGVVEEQDWARTKWLTASETFAALGWEWDVARSLRITGGLKELRCIEGHGYAGGEFKYHPTYIGIVRATEAPRFKKVEVAPGAPACFISYAHEDARLADRGVTLRFGRVAADDEAVAHRAVVEADLLDLEVAGHDVVAALAREGGLRLGALAPQLLAGDGVAARALEVAAVLGRREAPVGDHTTRPSFQADRSSLTERISTWSLALPGRVQTRIGIPSRVTASPIKTWGRSGRWSLLWPKVRKPLSAPRFGGSAASVSKYVLVVSKKRRSTSRLSRVATDQYTCSASSVSISRSQSMAR
jgi:hypothetical protein